MITVPCDTCAHRELCIYEKTLREDAECISEVTDDLKSVEFSPFTVNIGCEHFLGRSPLSDLSDSVAKFKSNLLGGDYSCSTST